MPENIFEDNVFEFRRIKIGDTFSLLCEYCYERDHVK